MHNNNGTKRVETSIQGFAPTTKQDKASSPPQNHVETVDSVTVSRMCIACI